MPSENWTRVALADTLHVTADSLCRPFWISWANNMLQVGRGSSVSGSTTFLKYQMTESQPISSISVSTGWGSTGHWIITNPHGMSTRRRYSHPPSVFPPAIGTPTCRWVIVNQNLPLTRLDLIVVGTRKGAWTPKFSSSSLSPGTEQLTYNSQFIEVNFYKPMLIKSVTTKGSASANEYVTEYSIQFSYNDRSAMEVYKTPGFGLTKV